MSKIKNGGLDQYGTGPFEQQQFGTAGVEGVNIVKGLIASECGCGQSMANIYTVWCMYDAGTRTTFQSAS